MEYMNKAAMALKTLLDEDIAYCGRLYNSDQQCQTFRRILIRAQFAFVEAGIYAMRYMAVEGDVTIIPKKTTAKDNLSDSFTQLAETLGLSSRVDKRSAGWDAMIKAFKIRDRVTHPKSREDLLISDADMEIFKRAVLWFSNEMHDLALARTAKITDGSRGLRVASEHEIQLK